MDGQHCRLGETNPRRPRPIDSDAIALIICTSPATLDGLVAVGQEGAWVQDPYGRLSKQGVSIVVPSDNRPILGQRHLDAEETHSCLGPNRSSDAECIVPQGIMVSSQGIGEGSAEEFM